MKNALMVWGGWDGHTPKECVDLFAPYLEGQGYKVEVFDTLWEAQVLIERWRQEYNRIRPHSALDYRPPAPEAVKVTPAEASKAVTSCFATLNSRLQPSLLEGLT